jgi:hypothetical protein
MPTLTVIMQGGRMSWSGHDQMAILWRREPVATRRNENQLNADYGAELR